MKTMKTKLTEEEAIRQVILDGTSGDFCDLADVVKKRFGLLVSTATIEDVCNRLQQVDSARPADSDGLISKHQPGESLGIANVPVKIGRIDLKVCDDISKSDHSPPPIVDQSTPIGSNTPSKQDRILDFVRMMGGFDAAKNAITDLDQSLKQLMKK